MFELPCALYSKKGASTITSFDSWKPAQCGLCWLAQCGAETFNTRCWMNSLSAFICIETMGATRVVFARLCSLSQVAPAGSSDILVFFNVWLLGLAHFGHFLLHLTEASPDAPDVISPFISAHVSVSRPICPPPVPPSILPLPVRIRKLLSVGDRNEERTAERWHWSVFSPTQLYQPSGTLSESFSQRGASSPCNLSHPSLFLFVSSGSLVSFLLFRCPHILFDIQRALSA